MLWLEAAKLQLSPDARDLKAPAVKQGLGGLPSDHGHPFFEEDHMGTKANPGSFDCYAKLEPNEPYFLIMGRDPMGQQLVEMWAMGAELRLYSMTPADPVTATKIREARALARQMGDYCRSFGKLPMRWNAKPPVINRKTEVTREQINHAVDVQCGGREFGLSKLILELARAAGVPE